MSAAIRIKIMARHGHRDGLPRLREGVYISKQETVADIVAQIRAAAYIQTADSPESVLRLADRIEAAHFRECEALREERNRAGLTEREKLAPRIRELEAENARLRAALKPVLECKVMSALAVGGIVEAGRKSERGNSAAMREALEKLKEAYFENDDGFARIDCSIVPDFEGLIDAALAAPARNCDLYATLDDARNAFFADYVPDETCSSATAFAIWLFDEAKGATDEQK